LPRPYRYQRFLNQIREYYIIIGRIIVQIKTGPARGGAPGVWPPSELRRKGALAADASGTLTWERDRDAVASADFRADTAGFILRYEDHGTDAPKIIEQRVVLSFVPAAFGGARAYFLCPGAECGRRVSVLYFRRDTFRCRHCHGLAYESQREDARRRARRRADKLRAPLGWPQRRLLTLPILVRPKGMWTRNFVRLRGHAMTADSVATAAEVAHWVRLFGRLDRRQFRTGRWDYLLKFISSHNCN
jgi:hypothetical protein